MIVLPLKEKMLRGRSQRGFTTGADFGLVLIIQLLPCEQEMSSSQSI